MIYEWTVPVSILEDLRQGLQATLNHLQAVDIANASKNLSPETKWSPLTVEVDNMLLKVEGYISEVAVAQYEAARDEAAELQDEEALVVEEVEVEDGLAEPNSVE